jgi:hypothetical protein
VLRKANNANKQSLKKNSDAEHIVKVLIFRLMVSLSTGNATLKNFSTTSSRPT